MFAAACGSDDPGDAAAVFPEQGFIGRKLTVEVTGDTTDWGAGSTVNFGDGVTVGAVTVVSPQALQVDLTINDTAVPGKNDVTVTSGGDTFTLPQAFELQSPVSVEALVPMAQGGLGLYTIKNLDLLHPFDTAVDDNGDPTGVTVTIGGTGLDAFVSNVTESEVTVQTSADIDGTSGALTIVSNDPNAASPTMLTSPAGNIDVEVRTATVLVDGTDATGTLAASGALYEFTATKDALIHLEALTDNTDADLEFIVMPASGKWADVTSGFTTTVDSIVPNGQKVYLSVIDLNLVNGYAYTIKGATKVDLTGVTAAPEAEPNGTSPTATVGTAAGPNAAVHWTGALADGTDVDFYKVTVTNGQKIHYHGLGSDVAIYQFTILNPNGTTVTKDGTGADISKKEPFFGDTDVTTAALTPGTYFIKIETDEFIASFGYEPANDAYDALITIE